MPMPTIPSNVQLQPLMKSLLLRPLSQLFGLGVWMRNHLYDAGWLKQTEFEVPVLVVGNLAVGGTGKTPHVEYLVRLLMEGYHVGVLSRGYKRETNGFVLASPQSHPEDIGDEPYQIYRKFGPHVTVAVCEDRVEGIRRMLEVDPAITMFILDDAFQHRAVKPLASVVLTEYRRPAFDDHLLPYGRLREPMESIARADLVVVTKCPGQMKPMDYRLFKEKLRLYPFQKLYFSRYAYGHLVPVFADNATHVPTLEELDQDDAIMCLTGIAHPQGFHDHLCATGARVDLHRYPDHHHFTQTDMRDLEQAWDQIHARRRLIVTTEKDAVRLLNNPYFPHRLKKHIFYIPVRVDFIEGLESGDFADGVRRAMRNGRLFKG